MVIVMCSRIEIDTGIRSYRCIEKDVEVVIDKLYKDR